MTSGNEAAAAGQNTKATGRNTTAQLTLLAGLISLLASCTAGTGGPLRPAWQQDASLYHHGTPDHAAQTATTPHVVARVLYATPEELPRLMQRQGDVVDKQKGPARMGDGTFDLGVQDTATGKWLESYLCGGNLFVTGLPNQAYRLVLKNRTPMPLQITAGIDGQDSQTGAPASYRRGTLRVAPQGTLVVGTAAHGPLLFKQVRGETALFDITPRGRTGLMQIAAYLAADAPSVGPEKMRASQIAPLGLLPLARPPEQYR